jgi:hypothetical protein
VNKWLVIGLGASLVPMWKDFSTGRGLNLWSYIKSTAFTKRKHITPDEAIENYRRNMGWT